jgi:cytochrome c2
MKPTQPGSVSSPAARVLAIGLGVAALLIGVGGPARAAGDAAAGRKLYQNKCLSCHGDAKTKGALGPGLAGIIGRKASDPVEGTTSRGMSEADFVWSEQTLDEYLAAPGRKVHGTIMPMGIADASERANLIAYIKAMR